MNRVDAYRMIRRRTADAGFKVKLGCHVFRATGITAYLEAGGTLENAQAMAAHESPRTTKLYDRTERCDHARRGRADHDLAREREPLRCFWARLTTNRPALALAPVSIVRCLARTQRASRSGYPGRD